MRHQSQLILGSRLASCHLMTQLSGIMLIAPPHDDLAPGAALANVGWCSPMAPSAGRPPDRREAGVSASRTRAASRDAVSWTVLQGRNRAVAGNTVRAGVLGANNGLVSNLSLVAGVAGAPLETALETSASSKRNGARGCAHTPGRRPLSSARRCRLAIAPAPANRPGETRDEGDRALDGSAGGERAFGGIAQALRCFCFDGMIGPVRRA